MMPRLSASRARAVTGSRWFRLTVRTLVATAVLTAIAARVGTGPFLHGLASLDVPTLGAAIVLCAVATAAAAWRWQLIARRLGVGLPFSTAVAMYYRSQFLNSVLPGGVIGDVQRAVEHGRSAESVGMATRAVAVDRVVGQVVQLALAVLVLSFFGAEFGGVLFTTIGVGLAALAVAVIAAMCSARFRRAVRHEVAELRAGLGSAAASAQVIAASVVVVGCHAAIFAIATTAVGAGVPPLRMAVLAIVVLLAASIPFNLGGWGPREGIAGWAFALAGFGASAGVASATLFGVLAFISVAAGVIVTRLASLIITRRNHGDRPSLRDPQLRNLPRRVPRHGRAAAARPLEPCGFRPGR